jgi:RNA polymerase sigma-70 factor (ECF subfamily)
MSRKEQRIPLASRSELSTFLAGVEKRAFKQAMFAVRDEEAALDIVQDAMLRLAEKYGHLPVGELPLLFHRIVQNAIRDWYRRQKVRSLWTTLLSSLTAGREDDDQDPLETLEAATGPTCRRHPRSSWRKLKSLKSLTKRFHACLRVNERLSSCVIGRNWTWPRPPRR